MTCPKEDCTLEEALAWINFLVGAARAVLRELRYGEVIDLLLDNTPWLRDSSEARLFARLAGVLP